MAIPLDRLMGRTHPVLGPRPTSAAGQWDELVKLISNSADVVRIAGDRNAGPPGSVLDDRELWQPAVDAAAEAVEVAHPRQGITRSFGAEL